MIISKFINIPIFLISLAFGIFAVYITLPDMRKIYVYPTPENVNKIQYRDKTDTCFSMKQSEVECPADESLVTKIKAQN